MATPIPDNQARFTLEEIARATGGALHAELAERQVRGVVTDSRRVQPGNLYVALSGERHDGHDFVQQARSLGAAAVLVEREDGERDAVRVPSTLRALGDLAAFHRGRWTGRLVAITGSVGKTTTKELTAAALRATGAQVLATQGNLNNLVGAPLTLLCLEPSHELAVIEVGTNAPGEIPRLAELCRPEVAIVTAVSLAHTQGLGSLEAVAEEKASLLWAVPESGYAIFPADEPALAPTLSRIRARKLSFGVGEGADIALLAHELSEDGTSVCAFRLPGGNSLSAELSLFGPGPVLDATAALAVVHALLGAEAVTQASLGLAGVAPVLGRLHPVPGPNESLLLDDSYNANPASVEASLVALMGLCEARGGRALCVLGDMRELGEHAAQAHRSVGELAAELGVFMFVGCGLEMEGAVEAFTEHAQGGTRSAHLDEPLDAPELLRDVLQPGDVLLVKGSRSMQMERVVEALDASVLVEADFDAEGEA